MSQLSYNGNVMKFFASLIIITSGFFVFSAPPANAASVYYVDCDASTNGDGSISIPWNTINSAKRSSGSVQPGDTVYIKGTCNYPGGSNFGASFTSVDGGLPGAVITYAKWPGQSLVIDGGTGNSDNAIFLVEGQYLTFDGFYFTAKYPMLGYLRAINIANGGNITVKNCFFDFIYYGISFGDNQINNLVFTNNTFYRNTAPLYLNQNDNVEVSHNTFMYTGEGLKMNPHYVNQTLSNVRVFDNFFYQVGWGMDNSDSDGSIAPFCNPGIIIDYQCNYCASGHSYILGVKIYNNIFWGNCEAGARISRPDVEMNNNTFYRNGYVDTSGKQPDASIGSTGGNGILVYNSPLGGSVIAKNNIFWHNKGPDIFLRTGATSTTASNMQGIDPLFVNGDPESIDPYNPNNYKLKPTSPAIGAGITIPFVADDFFGTSRPQGTGYDIGAYEYPSGGSGDITPPSAPTGVMVS